VTAGNGRDGIFVAQEEKPDLIVLDIMMPELGGYDFLRIYSKDADTPPVRYFCTGNLPGRLPVTLVESRREVTAANQLWSRGPTTTLGPLSANLFDLSDFT
jgi:CheY-like chemotaxis protein